MWLMTETGFISLVRDRDDADRVWVRARVRGDIAMFLPVEYEPLIQTDPHADYAYRICVPKAVVALQLFDQVMAIDYTSHAKEVMNKRSTPNAARMTALYDVWSAMANMQDLAPFTGTPRKVRAQSIKWNAYPPAAPKAPTGNTFKPLDNADDIFAPRPMSTGSYAWDVPIGSKDWEIPLPGDDDDAAQGAAAARDSYPAKPLTKQQRARKYFRK